jgi:hypothetical protein
MEEREISWLVFVSLLFTGTGGGHPEKADPPHYVEEKEEKGIREEIKEGERSEGDNGSNI